MAVPTRYLTRTLNQAALLTAGLEGLRGSSLLASAASHIASLLIVMLFAVGLCIRAARWIRDAVRSSGRDTGRLEHHRILEARHARHSARRPADDVPLHVRAPAPDDDPTLDDEVEEKR